MSKHYARLDFVKAYDVKTEDPWLVPQDKLEALGHFTDGFMAIGDTQAEALENVTEEVVSQLKADWPESKMIDRAVSDIVENGKDFQWGMYIKNEEVGFHFKIKTYVEDDIPAEGFNGFPGYKKYTF